VRCLLQLLRLLPALVSVVVLLTSPPTSATHIVCKDHSPTSCCCCCCCLPALQSVLNELDVPHRWPAGSPERGVYCSRTLNLRSIKAIGYDMDYTLIHYDVNAWEVRGRREARARGGWPVVQYHTGGGQPVSWRTHAGSDPF
jgi:hypothetical protein